MADTDKKARAGCMTNMMPRDTFQVLWCGLVLALAASRPVLSGTIDETGFEGGADESSYTQSSWVADGFNPAWVQGFNYERAHIDTAYAHAGDSSLRIDFPAGTVGPYSSGGGAQAPLLFTPQEEVYASYWLRFSGNFDWGGTNEGGKVPGLAGGALCSGGSTCDGTNGFTARLMWRPGGRAVLYLYHMDKPGSYGEDIPLITNGDLFYFQPGQWHQVVERVKINTANNYDGEVQLWIDGEEALLRTGLRFVNDGSLVDTFYFSTFHGGADASWAPSVDCYIWYDDLRIYDSVGELPAVAIEDATADESDAGTTTLTFSVEMAAAAAPSPAAARD